MTWKIWTSRTIYRRKKKIQRSAEKRERQWFLSSRGQWKCKPVLPGAHFRNMWALKNGKSSPVVDRHSSKEGAVSSSYVPTSPSFYMLILAFNQSAVVISRSQAGPILTFRDLAWSFIFQNCFKFFSFHSTAAQIRHIESPNASSPVNKAAVPTKCGRVDKCLTSYLCIESIAHHSHQGLLQTLHPIHDSFKRSKHAIALL